jgi:hypothetical protein
MKFWFCEKCGKRVTDNDIAEGDARDKKLKGVFCADCAVGVMTVEMDAITDVQLARATPKHPATPAGATPPIAHRTSHKNSNVKIQPVQRTSDQRSVPKKAPPSALVVLGSLTILMGAVVGCVIFFLSSSKQPSVVTESAKSPPPPVESAKPKPVIPARPVTEVVPPPQSP